MTPKITPNKINNLVCDRRSDRPCDRGRYEGSEEDEVEGRRLMFGDDDIRALADRIERSAKPKTTDLLDAVTALRLLVNTVKALRSAIAGAEAELATVRREHDRRVKGLLEANNREIERRRQAESAYRVKAEMLEALMFERSQRVVPPPAPDALGIAPAVSGADAEQVAAAAIAAFLRALPDLRVCGRSVCYMQEIAMSQEMLIEAVARAAQEGGR